MAWYPILFRRDLDPSRPLAISIEGRDLVLFVGEGGALSVLPDRCPHRAARLSDGKVCEGLIECGYHGWQFDGQGRCRSVPQLGRDRTVPAALSLSPLPVVERQGLIWVWISSASDPNERADEADIPGISDLDLPGVKSFDFVMDLPYGQGFLVENVIDFAHIHFAHDRSRGGGRKELAGPLAFEIRRESERGFTAGYRSLEHRKGRPATSLVDALVSFVAPTLVEYRSIFADLDRKSGLALYCVPMTPNRSRLLYRSYNSFPTLKDRLRPRWLDHLDRCKLIEEDMAIVVGQSSRMMDSKSSRSDLWSPIDTCDALVLRYRRWRDEHDFMAEGAAPSAPVTDSRLSMHTNHCSDCRRVFSACRKHAAWLGFAAFLLLALAVVIPRYALALALFALIATSLQRGLRGLEGRLTRLHQGR